MLQQAKPTSECQIPTVASSPAVMMIQYRGPHNYQRELPCLCRHQQITTCPKIHHASRKNCVSNREEARVIHTAVALPGSSASRQTSVVGARSMNLSVVTTLSASPVADSRDLVSASKRTSSPLARAYRSVKP